MGPDDTADGLHCKMPCEHNEHRSSFSHPSVNSLTPGVVLKTCLSEFVFNQSIIYTVHPFAHQFVKLDKYRHIYPPLPVFMPISHVQ